VVGWGIPTPTLVPWRQGFRLQQGTSVGVGLSKPVVVGRGKETLVSNSLSLLAFAYKAI